MYNAVEGLEYTIGILIKTVGSPDLLYGSGYLGIDWGGGEDPGAVGAWQWNTPFGTWDYVAFTGTATGNKITVFLDAYGPGVTYFDDLTGIGEDYVPPAEGDLGDVDFNSGYPVWVGNAVVTALASVDAAPTGFWIENQGRTVGAWVPTTEVPTVGSLVSIKGSPSKSASGERTLTPAEPIVQGAAADPVLTPLMMTNKTLGSATGSIGLATDGMLVKISGKVTGVSGAQGFFLDDGSGVPSDTSPILGVKVVLANGGFMDAEGVNNWQMIFESPQPCTAVVTGVVRLEKIGDTVYRRIDARSAADIVITAL